MTVATDDLTLQLRRCEFDAAPKNQLWISGYDGKIHSALEDSKCLSIAKKGRVRLEDCGGGSSKEFRFDGVGPIQVDGSNDCVTNRGINPNPSDYIYATQCLDRPDFMWEAVPNLRQVMIMGPSGCLQPRPGDDRRVYLEECDQELAWHLEPLEITGGFLLHSALDVSLCLRAGRGDTVEDGKWMRLAKCYDQEGLTEFHDVQQCVSIGPTGTSLHVANDLNFCLEHHGITPNVGKDFIILKACDASNPAKPWNLTLVVGDRSACVSQSVPEFVIDSNVNIGDTLYHPGPGFAISCGINCYRVKDSGDDPPFDPELGDTLRFAYKKISGRRFSIRSKVCGMDCDGSDGFVGQFGRTGLMIRGGLDPLSKNIFVSHSPNGQADWSHRSEYGGATMDGFDGSPDVPCLWITLERINDDFLFSYAYEGQDDCDMEPEFLKDLNGRVTIDMPDEVFVGLAVSTGVAPPYCSYTEAEFLYIECLGCESALS